MNLRGVLSAAEMSWGDVGLMLSIPAAAWAMPPSPPSPAPSNSSASVMWGLDGDHRAELRL